MSTQSSQLGHEPVRHSTQTSPFAHEPGDVQVGIHICHCQTHAWPAGQTTPPQLCSEGTHPLRQSSQSGQLAVAQPAQSKPAGQASIALHA